VKNIVLNKFFYILAWIYTLFISLFGFDEKFFSWGFLIHQVPVFVLMIINIIYLKNSKLAGFLYLVVFFVFTLFFQTYKDLNVFLLISLPLLLLGLVFLKKKS